MTPNTAVQQQLQARNARLQEETELMCRFAPDGTLTFVNQTYCHKLGKTPEMLLGTSFFASVFPEDREVAKKHLANLSKDHPIGTLEWRVILPHGEVHWYQWTNYLFCDQQGQADEFQAVGRDITAYKEVEDELAGYHEQVYDLVIERTRELTQRNEQLQQEIAEHKRTEQALRLSEQQYRLLAEHVADGVAIVQEG